MKISSKALLLSILVFPGAGHFILKKRVESLLLMSTAIICLYVIISKLYAAAQMITNQIQSGELPFDIQVISDKLHSEAFSGDLHQVNIALLILFITWLIGVVDSYRQGLKKDVELYTQN